MEQNKVIEVLNKKFDSRWYGDKYVFDTALVDARSGTKEFIEVDLKPGLNVDGREAEIEYELSQYLFKKYEHDDVYVFVIDRFNIGLIIVMNY